MWRKIRDLIRSITKNSDDYDEKYKSKNKLKEIHIKNRTCYYFDDIMSDIIICSDDTLLDKKSN